MMPLPGHLQLHLLLLLISWMIVSGWVSNVGPAVTTVRRPAVSHKPRSLSTALFMFDWMKPKPPPKKDDSDKGGESQVEKRENAFGNFFNVMNAPNAAPAPVSEESAKATKAESPDAVEDVSKDANVDTQAKAATAETGKRYDGKVSWFNSQKGFGFILPDDLSLTMDEKNDIFVHHSEIQDPDAGFRKLTVGERVQFEVERDNQGRTRAIHVTGPDSGPVRAAVKRAERKTKNA